MMELMLYVFLGGFLLFLMGMFIFMHFENRKFEDNQYMVKLLPPPPRLATAPVVVEEKRAYATEISSAPFP